MKENRKRTIFKTLSRRVLATILTISIVYWFTKELVLATGVGLIEVVVKLLAYYIHERTRNKISYWKENK